jgi:hypothetical protein
VTAEVRYTRYNMKKNIRTTHKQSETPAFVLRAERAFRRVAKNVRTQNRAFKLPLILWQDGKLVKKSV